MPDGTLHVFFKIIIKVLSYKINFIIPRIHLNENCPTLFWMSQVDNWLILQKWKSLEYRWSQE